MILPEEIYLDTLSLKEFYKDYKSPKAKLTTLIRSGKIIHIRRGLYIPGGKISYSLKTLANKIYSPSYISFEYALSYYSFIPERVEVITSAAFRKNKNKRFDTPVGSFLYHTIPEEVYYLDVRLIEELGHPFLMASKEKALCDTLYLHRQIQSLSQMRKLLFDDMRIDQEELWTINANTVNELAPLYKKHVLMVFCDLLSREATNA